MSRHPLVLALAAVIPASALLPAAAHAEDLLQTYELARAGDPQFSAAESGRLVTREGSVQARAALLPQIGADASLTRSRSTSSASALIDPDDDPTTPNDDFGKQERVERPRRGTTASARARWSTTTATSPASRAPMR